MSLNVLSWKEFRFGDLISDIYKARAINKDDLTIATDSDNSIRYITRTGENNGCELLADTSCIDDKMIEKGNAISIGDTTATCFYQEEDFITGDHMVVVRADSWLNPYTALYVVTILANEQYKYSYGRAFLMDRIKDTILKLPSDSDGNPDWQFMEDYIKSLHHKPLTTKNKKGQAPDLNVQNWGEFRVGDLFTITGSTTTPLEDLEDIGTGKYPYVTTSAEDNGVAGYYAKYTEEGNIICVESACAGYTTYQAERFTASDHVEKCIPTFSMNEYIGVFLATIFNLDQYKYSYGRKCNQIRIRDRIIKLPVDSDSNPDWQFMENYIKALPYGDRLKDVVSAS